MKIETKFNIGDKVFRGFLVHEPEHETCSFCGGEGKIEILGKNGEKDISECCKCSGQRRILRHFKYTTKTEILTIGSVRFNSHDEDQFSYMCKETGIGSGNVYYEKELFFEENDALLYAKKLENQAN